jgi:hypothetical protein
MQVLLLKLVGRVAPVDYVVHSPSYPSFGNKSEAAFTSEDAVLYILVNRSCQAFDRTILRHDPAEFE